MEASPFLQVLGPADVARERHLLTPTRFTSLYLDGVADDLECIIWQHLTSARPSSCGPDLALVMRPCHSACGAGWRACKRRGWLSVAIGEKSDSRRDRLVFSGAGCPTRRLISDDQLTSASAGANAVSFLMSFKYAPRKGNALVRLPVRSYLGVFQPQLHDPAIIVCNAPWTSSSGPLMLRSAFQ